MLLAFIVSGLVAAGSADTVQFFEGSYAKALEKAASKKTPLFVDFYTDWCGWCKVIDQKVYTDPAVAKLMNEKLVSMKINAEKGEGPTVAKEFKVNGYPTAVIVDPATKKELDRIVGYAPPEQYLEKLKNILAGNSFFELKKKAEAGSDVEAWFKYAKAVEERGDPGEMQAAWKKVASLDPDDAKGKGGIADVSLARVTAFTKRDPKPLLDAAKKYDGKPPALEAHKYVIFLIDRLKDDSRKDQIVKSFEYLVTHGARDPETLNNYAWFLALRGESLEKALGLAREALKEQPKASHILDTAAECLSRLGRKDEAVETSKKALEAAPEAQKDQYRQRLKEIEGQSPNSGSSGA